MRARSTAVLSCLFLLASATGLLFLLAAGTGCYRLEHGAGLARCMSPAHAPAGGGFAAADELWIIERPKEEAAAPDDSVPGQGTLMAKPPGGEKEVPLPLQHTDVRAGIGGYIATVAVTQQYRNPYDGKIEAVYVFPLPHNAAVNEFVMKVGDRLIRGIIREREEAERIYAEARSQGYVASLLTQERPNVFTQKVANIEPGKAIDIEIRYFHTLAYADGWYEWVFPMVVGPRFNPPGFRGGIGGAGRGAQGVSGQPVEVPYLKPGERSGHDIALRVSLDAGVSLEGLESPTHAVDASRPDPHRAEVALRPADAVPNRDFVLRWKVAGDRVKSGFLAARDKRGGFFTMMVYPPAELAALPRQPMEMVFVLDCSGSMDGAPLAKAKQAMERALRRLDARDTFQIVRFSDQASALGPAPVPATPENVRRGLAHLASLRSEGGTMMVEGIKAALDFPRDPERFRIVSFMTDGYIGNEAEIFAEIGKRIGDARLFSFGVGEAVNRHLLEGMARMGRGAVAYVGLDESGGRAVDAFYDRLAHPAMTDIEVDWGGLKVSEVFPRRVPDLFVGRAVVLTGRFEGGSAHTIRLKGRAGEASREVAVRADLDGSGKGHPGLPCVWARQKIEWLEDRMTRDDNPDLRGEVRGVALEFGLMSSFTAFVAADASARTAGEHGTTVPVAVPVPAGVRYETTVQEGPAGQPR